MEKLRFFFLGLFFVDLVLHIFISLGRYQPSMLVSTTFTALMFIAWFYIMRSVRALEQQKNDVNPLVKLFTALPYPMRLTAYFLIVYALANFILTLETHTAPGLIDTHPSLLKLRGISGFWIMFSFLAFVFGGRYGLAKKK